MAGSERRRWPGGASGAGGTTTGKLFIIIHLLFSIHYLLLRRGGCGDIKYLGLFRNICYINIFVYNDFKVYC